MLAFARSVFEPVWEMFEAGIPPRPAPFHPLGCHRRRVPIVSVSWGSALGW